MLQPLFCIDNNLANKKKKTKKKINVCGKPKPVSVSGLSIVFFWNVHIYKNLHSITFKHNKNNNNNNNNNNNKKEDMYRNTKRCKNFCSSLFNNISFFAASICLVCLYSLFFCSPFLQPHTPVITFFYQVCVCISI